MPYVKKKLSKDRPDCHGKVIIDKIRPGYLVMWKYKTKRPPAPKKWANLVVFLKDKEASKRSYHVAWGWHGFASSEQLARLMQEQPAIFHSLRVELEPKRSMLLKQPKYRDEEEFYDE